MVMNELRRQGVLCDVTLVAEGVRFPVHKLVVASCSPYFRAMFNGAMSESHQDVVSLEAVQANALKQLVDYIYTGEIEVTFFHISRIFDNLFRSLRKMFKIFYQQRISLVLAGFVTHAVVFYNHNFIHPTALEYAHLVRGSQNGCDRDSSVI